MNSWCTVAVFLKFVVFVTSSMDFSKFRVTKVLNESCTRVQVSSVFIFRSRFLCALECSKNVNCRRMMFQTHGNVVKCSLFYEGLNCATLQPTDCSCYMKSYSKLNNKTVCPLGLYGDYCENILKDCSDGYKRGLVTSYAYVRSYIQPLESPDALEVLCDFRFGGFTYFMTRSISCQRVSFNRNITEYIDGFGDPNGDHWLGLKTLKEILGNNARNRLHVLLKINDELCVNKYNDFSIGAAADGYPIRLSNLYYARCNGDSFKGSINIDGSPFSAPGSDHTSFNCADTRQGGWWYANDSRCSESDFMGSRDNMLWSTSLNSTPQTFVSLRVSP